MDIEEIEELIEWNYSFGISIEKTLLDINRLDLFPLFVGD